MTPRTFGRFTIHRKLPAGGMGRVYEAMDAAAGRRVALKLIDRGTDPDSIEIVAAERHGALLQKQLCGVDSRVTAIYEFGDLDDYFFIIMEYVDGQDLSELTAAQRIGYPFAARIAQDVLEVLHHAHDLRTEIEGREYRGIVHGDIKPRNIRLTTVGQVKVLDFGIAKALSLTRKYTQNQFGSVQYSSPERLNTGEVTVASDLWSVAVVLYELVAGRPYFEADTGPKLERLVRGYQELRPLPEGCPEELKRILARALAPDPDMRYSTAEEFASDLRAYRSGQPVQAPADFEATRRTFRPAQEEETRRTSANGVVTVDPATADIDVTRRSPRNPAPLPNRSAAPAAVAATSPPKRSERPRIRWGRIALLAFLLLGAYVGYAAMSEYIVWRDAREFAYELDTERLKRLDVAWQRYEKLSARARTGVSLWSARDSLRARLLSDADRTINEYRNSDTPSVSETEWQRARASAVHALELMPDDRGVKGRLRLIDGHLARIRGTARRDGQLLQTARENFSEAAQLLPKSPDPWLGLARLYVYSLRDVERAEDALRAADKRGHDLGKRETAQLADGYRDRGERLLRDAASAIGQPEYERLLNMARKDLERARELYESVVPFGGSLVSLRRTHEGLDRVELMKSQPEEQE